MRWSSAKGIALGVGLIALAVIVQQSPRALLYLATDGAVAAGILGAASSGGLWLVKLLRCGGLPRRWQLLLGAGLGIGALCLLVLVLGLLGLLSRPLWIGVLIAMGLGGLPRLLQLQSKISDLKHAGSKLEIEDPLRRTRNSKLGLLWLLAAPFAALTLLVALVPPGLFWAEEAHGYDALEYHLQMPREYFEAGRIEYAPHNVYANFPSNAEMLYLLAMVVTGDPLQSAIVGQLINALLAFLAVAAAWLAGRELSPAAGHVAGVLAATCGWLVYLSGVAYVENAMLFFGMLSAGLAGSALRTGMSGANGPGCGPYRRLIAAGALAGFSAGCKYTALVLVVIPVALAVLAGARRSVKRGFLGASVFAIGALASLAPWLLKNLAFTGNPVFPLAHRVFPGAPDGWSHEAAEHFARSHAPAPEESPMGHRVRILWDKVLGDRNQRFGPALFILGAGGVWAALRGPCHAWSAAVVLASQLAPWLALTHLYARFAVVLLLPLVLLAAQFFSAAGRRARGAAIVTLVVGSLWNLAFIANLYRRHVYLGGQRLNIEGATEVFAAGDVGGYQHLKVINRQLPADARLLLVGEARAFYFLREADYRVVFNRDPFIELLKASPAPEEVRSWLAERRFTHVFVVWSEIRRLSRSRYGFHGLDDGTLQATFDALTSAAVLERTHAFTLSAGAAPYAGLYRVR